MPFFLGASTLVATAAEAPVRRAVRFDVFRIAIGFPVGGSRRMVTDITVGNPILGLSGCTFTTLTPATFNEGRYEGIVLKSPPGRSTYTFGGITHLSSPWSVNAVLTAAIRSSISITSSGAG